VPGRGVVAMVPRAVRRRRRRGRQQGERGADRRERPFHQAPPDRWIGRHRRRCAADDGSPTG